MIAFHCIGKSYWLSNLLKEYRYHFSSVPKRLVYFFKEEDDEIKNLKAFFEDEKEVESIFSRKIPDDLSPLIIKNSTIFCFDDLELYFNEKQNAETLYNIASVLTSHLGLITFFCVQSFSVLRKDSLVNRSVLNSTHLCFFRTAQDARTIKYFMGNFSLRLKSSQSLWDVFQKYIQRSNAPFGYLLLCVSPKCRVNTVFTNILMCSDGPMIGFHESDDDSDVD